MKISPKYLLLAFYAFILLGLVAIVYSSTLSHSFLRWDDDDYVFNNPWLANPGINSPSWMISSLKVSNWHPLTWLSYSLDYALFGLSPAAFHASNIIIHAANSLLLFGLLVWALPIYFSGYSDKRTQLAAFCGAAFFAIHPQHVEAVAWVSERKELLCFFFSLLTVWMYLLSQHKDQKKTFYVLCLICYLLALSAKAMAVALPLLLWFYDWQQGKAWLANSLQKTPFFILSGIVSVLTIYAQKGSGAVVSLSSLSVKERLLNAAHSIWKYFQDFIFPVDLSPYYSYPFPLTVSNSRIIIALIFIVSVTALAYWLSRRGHPSLLTAWSFYIISLLPVLGLIQVGGQASADRYAYWSTLSFYVLIAIATLKVVHYRPLLIGGVTIMIFIFGLTARQQTTIWKNDLSLWSYAIAQNQKNVMINIKLADALMHVNQYELALKHYRRALLLSPKDKRGQLTTLHHRLKEAYEASNGGKALQ